MTKAEVIEAYQLIPPEVLATIPLVSIAYRCHCNKLHRMDNLMVEKICRCGRTIRFSPSSRMHYMRNDDGVRKQVRAIMRKIKQG